MIQCGKQAVARSEQCLLVWQAFPHPSSSTWMVRVGQLLSPLSSRRLILGWFQNPVFCSFLLGLSPGWSARCTSARSARRRWTWDGRHGEAPLHGLWTSLLVLSRECGNEPRPLKGNHQGWFIGVIPSFPAEHQQASFRATLCCTR